MKKFLSIIFALALIFTLTGCTDTTTSLASNINQSVDRLKTVLNQTKEVSNENLVFDEIISLSELQNKYSTESNTSDSTNNTNQVSNKTKTSNINSVQKTTTNKITNNFSLPNLTRQIVKNDNTSSANSSLDLTSKNQLFQATPNRLSAKRTSVTSRLTSAYYTPRRISEVNYNNTNFSNYLGELEDLYLMMNDAVSANDSICSCKDNILECCDLLDILSGQLKSKEIELTDDECNSCNNLLDELGSCTNKVTSSRNDVTNSCTVLKQSTPAVNLQIDKINSNYIRLINCLDNRASYYESILSVLKQLQCILTGDCYSSNDTTSDSILENATDNSIENTTDDTSTISNRITANNSKISMDNTSNLSDTSILDLLNRFKGTTNNDLNSTSQTDNQNATDDTTNSLTDSNSPNTISNNKIKNLPYKSKNLIDNIKNRTSKTETTDNNISTNDVPNNTNTANQVANTTENSSNANNVTRRIPRTRTRVNATKSADFNDINDTNRYSIATNEENNSYSNIDTYKEQTISPNIIKSTNNNQNNNQNNEQNGQLNNNNTQNRQNNNNDQNGLNNQYTNNSNYVNQGAPNNTISNGVNTTSNTGVGVTPNVGVAPNVNTYGNGYYYNNTPAIGSAVGNAINGVGIASNGVTGYGTAGYGTGVGYETGLGYGNAYNGIHNYETGITNPFRNTDTYKLSLTSLDTQPLPSETRRDFKPFTDVNVEEFNQNLDINKINPLLSDTTSAI